MGSFDQVEIHFNIPSGGSNVAFNEMMGYYSIRAYYFTSMIIEASK